MKKTILIGSIGLLFACANDQEPTGYVEPDMAREDFIPIMVDLHILESHYQRLYTRPNVYKESLDSASSYVFEKHGTTRETYLMTLNQFSYSSDTIFKIYEAAFDTITLRINQQ